MAEAIKTKPILSSLMMDHKFHKVGQLIQLSYLGQSIQEWTK